MYIVHVYSFDSDSLAHEIIKCNISSEINGYNVITFCLNTFCTMNSSRGWTEGRTVGLNGWVGGWVDGLRVS
jgi:hypothetical protein